MRYIVGLEVHKSEVYACQQAKHYVVRKLDVGLLCGACLDEECHYALRDRSGKEDHGGKENADARLVDMQWSAYVINWRHVGDQKVSLTLIHLPLFLLARTMNVAIAAAMVIIPNTATKMVVAISKLLRFVATSAMTLRL